MEKSSKLRNLERSSRPISRLGYHLRLLGADMGKPYKSVACYSTVSQDDIFVARNLDLVHVSGAIDAWYYPVEFSRGDRLVLVQFSQGEKVPVYFPTHTRWGGKLLRKFDGDDLRGVGVEVLGCLHSLSRLEKVADKYDNVSALENLLQLRESGNTQYVDVIRSFAPKPGPFDSLVNALRQLPVKEPSRIRLDR